jgi:SAM-dependent methyltransferase
MKIEENRHIWDTLFDWSQRGEEWSLAWGGSEPQWFGCLFPRIHRYLPAATILEIAPGFGRWTRYLLGYSKRLLGVDLSTVCVEACRKRFAGEPAEFYANDGTSLDMIADQGIDFACSLDSLVHAEAAVLQSYCRQLARKLAPDGVAFIHHSNLGACGGTAIPNPGTRAPSMTADLFLQFCQEAEGLVCISQELVNWGQPELVDCFSVITLRGSRFEQPRQRLENPNFMVEAGIVKCYSALYNGPLPAENSRRPPGGEKGVTK